MQAIELRLAALIAFSRISSTSLKMGSTDQREQPVKITVNITKEDVSAARQLIANRNGCA